MFVPFHSLPDSARIWIYQSNRRFTSEELHAISAQLQTFTQQWAAHNQQLHTSFTILHDQFIVLAVDENVNGASGCSIDASVQAIKSISTQVQANFLNRSDVAFLIDSEVLIIPLPDLKAKLQEGVWNAETVMFNNVIQTKGELEHNWRTPAGKSWLKRYLVQATV
jgi:hypothetical protein